MKLKKSALKISPEKTAGKIQEFIAEHVKKLNRSGVAVGLSGGLDSCVLAYLCVRALGKDKVRLVFIPEKDTAKETYQDVKLIARRLGISVKTEDITPVLKKAGAYKFALNYLLFDKLKALAIRKKFEAYTHKFGRNPFADMTLGADDPLLNSFSAYIRIKHRARLMVLYHLAEKSNLLVAGGANKTELLTGWFVKFGIDHCTDIMPLGGLYKGQVKQLGEYLKIPKKILDKKPIPDLAPGIADENILGLDYDNVDLAFYGFEKKFSVKQIAEQLNIPEEKVKFLQELHKASWHMRNYSLIPNI